MNRLQALDPSTGSLISEYYLTTNVDAKYQIALVFFQKKLEWLIYEEKFRTGLYEKKSLLSHFSFTLIPLCEN
jgi:hypothetical protein